MPISINANFEIDVIDSIKDYLVQYVITPYNALVAGTDFSTPLGVDLEHTPDPTKVPVMPLLLVYKPVTNAPYASMGNGDSEGWIFKSYRIACFPATTNDNKLLPQADFYLRSMMATAFETALYLPIYNHTTTPKTMVETAQVSDARIVMPIGKSDNIMDIERYRFDVVFTLEVPVVSTHG